MNLTPLRPQRGFSLAELAVVLVIVSLLTAGGITALRAQSERSRLLETRAQLAEAREALLNYAAVTGTLPCPDTTNDGDADTCNTSGVDHGRLPWRLLGLPRFDPWGQNLHYAVHTSFATGKTIALTTESALEIQNKDGAGALTSLANEKAVAMALWSAGPDSLNQTPGSPASKLIAEAPDSDDIVIWLSRFVLIGRMLEAGRDVPQ